MTAHHLRYASRLAFVALMTKGAASLGACSEPEGSSGTVPVEAPVETPVLADTEEASTESQATASGTLSDIDITIEGVDGWITQAKAEFRPAASGATGDAAFIPADGRLTRRVPLDGTSSGDLSVRLTTDLQLSAAAPRDIFVILQSGCVHEVLEGRRFELVMSPGSNRIDQTVTLTRPADCVMARIWSASEPMDVVLSDTRLAIRSAE